jgi:hypothetical protein
VPRALDDVGGLLDTSKGWTLSIPAPDESGGAAAQMIAAQKGVRQVTEVAAATRSLADPRWRAGNRVGVSVVMASIPFIGPAIRHRQPMTGARMIIVASAAAFFLFLIWASLAHLDEITRGQGKVIPSSKLQVITAADPATVSQILVRSGQRVHKGQLLVRLDSPESTSQLGQIQAETESLQARSARLTSEGTGSSVACKGTDCAGEEALQAARESAVRSKVAALNAAADQARRDAGEAAATIQSLQGSLALAQNQVTDAATAGGQAHRPANRPARQTA